MGTSFWISCLLFFTTLVSWGQALRDPAGLAVPENDETRLALRRVITAPLGEVLENLGRERLLSQRGSPLAVRFRVETQNGSVYLLFLNERASGFPVHGSGSVIIRRSRTDGAFQQMKIFYRDPASHRPPPRDPRLAMDSGSFVRITPEGARSRMDVYLFDRRLYAAVVLPAPFESLLTSPFERIRRLSAGTVDWPLLLDRGDAPSSARTLALLERLRPLLPSLRVEEDGALDADGRFVHIAEPAAGVEPGGFNCSGFAKWVVDGFYGPLAGGYLPVAGVKARFGEHAGNRWNAAFERQREPYFGLDWSRSLAVLLSEAGGSGDGSAAAPRAATGAVELQARLLAQDVRLGELLPYVEEAGYRVEDLELALFVDTVRRPGHFYLASINGEKGKDPVLHQHYHLAVLFPSFLPDGSFRVQVMERYGAGVAERGLAALQTRHRGDYAHLVRLPMGEEYSPPPLPPARLSVE